MRPVTGAAGKFGQSVDSEVHFSGAPTEFVVAQLRDEFTIEVLFPDETEVGSTRVESGYDCVGLNLVTIFERNTDGLAVLDDDAADTSLSDNLCSIRLRGACNRFADATGAAFGKAPGAHCTIDLAHIVMQ